MTTEQEQTQQDHEQIEENSDGTILVRLKRTVTIGREPYERVTIRELTGRQMRRIEGAQDNASAAAIMDVANELSDPPGIADMVRCQQDLTAIMEATTRQVGKFTQTGEPA